MNIRRGKLPACYATNNRPRQDSWVSPWGPSFFYAQLVQNLSGIEFKIMKIFLQSVPALRRFWDFKKKTRYAKFELGGHSQTTFTRFVFFDHLPPSLYIFYGIKVYEKLIFWTTYQPSLVNVVCERPLIEILMIRVP